ncbi:peptidylprolyl isomerase [Buchnera aphidicola (Melanaphis sacchari)]|uniref:Peptidylprolyl isomerase n=1 Tax=Buchnera aphidicola (Melanaphis sacchari) TaxID=2173854 RepID=A0A2U8DGP1_9GAMM|nr:peptidylprolyl isomerase [Buchnera aphidicola (Melanaphis sacchari)]
MIMKVCFFLILYIFWSFFYIHSEELDKIVAIVNNQVILESDVDKEIHFLKKEYLPVRIPLKVNFLKDQIINKLITDALILEEAKKFHVTVTNDQLNNIFQETALRKNLTISELKQYILSKEVNQFISYNDYIKNIKKLLTIKIMQDYELQKRVRISEKEIYLLFNKTIKSRNQLKRVNLRYIYLPNFQKNSIKFNKKLLINNLMISIKKKFSFDYFYNNFKKKRISSIFFVKKILSISLKDVQKNFSSKIDFLREGQVLGPIVNTKGIYIFKIDRIIDNEEKVVNEFHIQHCLIRPSIILSDIEAKEKIFKIYNNIKSNNYSFDYAIKFLSHDVYSSKKKGDLGWIQKDFFDGISGNILFFLKKNNISKPVKSKFGWHIIKLLDIRKINSNFNLEKDRIRFFLLKHKLQKEKEKWIKELKDISYIKIV